MIRTAGRQKGSTEPLRQASDGGVHDAALAGPEEGSETRDRALFCRVLQAGMSKHGDHHPVSGCFRSTGRPLDRGLLYEVVRQRANAELRASLDAKAPEPEHAPEVRGGPTSQPRTGPDPSDSRTV